MNKDISYLDKGKNTSENLSKIKLPKSLEKKKERLLILDYKSLSLKQDIKKKQNFF